MYVIKYGCLLMALVFLSELLHTSELHMYVSFLSNCYNNFYS